MRIGEGLTPGPVSPADTKVGSASPAQASGKNAVQTESRDVAEFGTGSALLQMSFQLSAISRQNRVEEIRGRLVSGDYHIGSDDVSRAIVADMLSRGFPGTPKT
jgi:anti-sigma28 factor (negative regulator of flagellin synthesis)